MPLKLTIISYQRLSPGQETTKVLDRGSISIGRSAQNDWILQDPERILSGKHCTVHHQDGGYFLTDTSTNGVYLNDSEQRLERLATVRLQDGDRFILGEYEIAATLLTTADEETDQQEGPITDVVRVASVTTHAFGSALPAAGIVSLDNSSAVSMDANDSAGVDAAVPPPAKSAFTDIFAEDDDGLELAQSSSARAVATEPPLDLANPDRAFFEPPKLLAEAPPPAPEPAPIIAVPDHDFEDEATPPALILPEAASQPLIAERTPDAPSDQAAEASAESIIPEDWWMAAPTPAATVQPVAPPPKPVIKEPPSPVFQPTVESPPAQFAQSATTTLHSKPAASPEPSSTLAVVESPKRPVGFDSKILLRAFLEGAGLPNARLPDEQLPEIMANLGAIFRATVQGMMEILLARSDVKGEFRLDRTNIGPMENNPLKTPPGRPPLSPEEVMILLLIRRKDAYMSPVQAVCEGFDDIKAHQLAVMAGIQAALSRLLERFAPSNLETRLQQTVLDSILPANRKAKYWDLFTAEYRSIAHEAEEDFNELFGNEFARAYQERLRTHH